MNEGKFIVVEGISGSGKGTQLQHIAKYLFESDKYSEVLLTREPTGSSYGQEARTLMQAHRQDGEDPTLHAHQYLDLFLKDRIYHLSNTIIPSLEKGIQVVCDRYALTTMALQQGPSLSVEDIIKKHQQRTIRVPDLTLLFDLPAEEALSRIQQAGRAEKGVHETRERLSTARKNYLQLSSLLPKYNITVVNAQNSPEEIFKCYRPALEVLFP